jgi:hypothetical protein
VFPHPTLYNKFVYIPTRYIDSTEVDKAVDEFLKTLGPEVVRVRYNIGEDWMGNPALYFGVVLSDSVAGSPAAFHGAARRIRRSIFDQLKALENWDKLGFISLRQLSKQCRASSTKRSEVGMSHDGLPR